VGLEWKIIVAIVDVDFKKEKNVFVLMKVTCLKIMISRRKK